MEGKSLKKMGGVALSALLASSLSVPAVAMAETTDAPASQTGISAQAGDATAGQSATPEPEANSREARHAPRQGAQDGIEEPAVDKITTAPNNVNTAAPSDDKQGSDISYKANASVWGMNIPLADSTATITTEDADSGKTLGEVSQDFKGTDLGGVKAGDLVVKGDMSIEGDSTKDAAHGVEKDSKHDIKADLDVSAIHTSIEKSGSLLSDSFGGANAAKAVYVNDLETGLRSTFTFGSDLSGEFYVPSSLEDARAHYILASADGAPLIYRINYSNSTFAKDKVVILMDLDLTHVGARNTTYNGSSKVLYGENGVMENFNHTDAEYGSTYDTSTFGNFEELITSSAKKISLLLKDVLFHSATGNSTTTETDTGTTTTTQGSIHGTLVGYMKADVGHSRVKGNVSYVWGAMQDAGGRDVNAKDDKADKVMLTTQFSETTQKADPGNPDTPGSPDAPANPGAQGTPGASDGPATFAEPARAADEAAEYAASETPETIPQTGDASNPLLWLAMAVASAGACVAGAFRSRRRKASGK